MQKFTAEKFQDYAPSNYLQDRQGDCPGETSRHLEAMSIARCLPGDGTIAAGLKHFGSSHGQLIKVYQPNRRGRGRQLSGLTLLFGNNPDATKLALLNKFDKSNVRLMKRIMSHGRPGLAGFLTKPLIHRQSLFKNWAPLVGQISG